MARVASRRLGLERGHRARGRTPASGRSRRAARLPGVIERYPWIDAFGAVDESGPSQLTDNAAASSMGRCVLLRPRIGSMIPVFVVDRYEGSTRVRRFVDLSETGKLEVLNERRCVAGRRGVARRRSRSPATRSQVRRSAGARSGGRYVAKIHGSDIEYAVRIRSGTGSWRAKASRRARRRRTDRPCSRDARPLVRGSRAGSNGGAGCGGLRVPADHGSSTDGGGGSARRGPDLAREADRRRSTPRWSARSTCVSRRSVLSPSCRPGRARAGRGAAASPPRRTTEADRGDTWAS